MSTPKPKVGRVRVPTFQLGLDPSAVADAIIGTFHQPGYTPPIAPSVAIELYELSRKPDVEMAHISHVLSRDPMLAARVLRVAQSSLYSGPAGHVTSLEDATVRLGLTQLSQLFLETALSMRVFRAAGFEKVMEDLLVHSVHVARAAKALARDVDLEPDQAFLFGLLHDIGYAGALIVVADGQASGFFPRMPFDQVRMAIDSIHTQAGGIIARLWSLPPDVARVIENHHRWILGTEVYREGALLSVIEAYAASKHETVVAPHTVDQAREALGIDDKRLAEVWAEATSPAPRSSRATG